MSTVPLVVFIVVYAGMLLGGLPRLRLDRTGVALLGAIALLATGYVTVDEALQAVDVPTLSLLFGLMVVSAQLRLGGFYTHAARGLTAARTTPGALLAVLILGTGLLSAVFSNDIVCLALTPVVLEVCRHRRLDPVPFLLAVACASNVGSAATLIGNPQNMLIGQTLGIPFAGYLRDAGLIALLGLGATWAVIAWQHRRRWQAEVPIGEPPPLPVYDRWQSAKGLLVAGALLVVFLFTGVPREVAALTAAGLLMLSRRLHSRDMLGLVDWQLLLLFTTLFVVNHAFRQTTWPGDTVRALMEAGADPRHPAALFGLTVVLSNAVSNVPAVMLLLQLAYHPLAGLVLALASTFAGNLLIVGSIANIIVVDGAARQGVTIDWRRHARTGLPVTLVTLMIAAAGLWVLSLVR